MSHVYHLSGESLRVEYGMNMEYGRIWIPHKLPRWTLSGPDLGPWVRFDAVGL